MTVREMQLDDLSEVIEIEKQNFSIPWTEMGFFSFFLRDDTLFLVAEEEGKILGYMGIMMVLDEGEITNVVVAASYRRQGIGRQMLEYLLREVKTLGIGDCTLEVRVSNTPAIRLYESLGFQGEGIRPNFYEKPVEDALIMWKR